MVRLKMNKDTANCIQGILHEIDKLKDRIAKHRDKYSKNEWLVRYSLIDPFLKLLGWDVENPEEVMPELTNAAGRPDYTLFKSNKKLAFIGAKKLGANEDINQHLNYCIREGVIYFITTDGNHWSVYDNSFYQKPITERVTIEWSLSNELTEDIFIKSLYISKLFFGRKYNMPVSLELKNTGIPDNMTDITQHDITVPMKTDEIPNKKIRSITIQNTRIETNSAKEVLINTFKWLSNNGYLKYMKIPVKSGKVRYVVNTSPVDQNGQHFKNPAHVGDYYIECNNSSDRSIQLAKILLENAGLSSDILKIEVE